MPAPVLSHLWDYTTTGSPSVFTLNGGAPFAPTAGVGYVLVVLSGATSGTSVPADTVDATAVGLTFTLCGYTLFSSGPARCVAVYSSQPAAPVATGSIIATFGVIQSGLIAMLLPVANPGSTGLLADGLLQQIKVGNSGTFNVGTFPLTLDAPAGAGASVGAVFASNIAGALTPTSGSFTELADVAIAGGRNLTMEVQWRNAADLSTTGVNVRTSLDAATVAKVAGIIFELAPAGTGLTVVGRSVSVAWSAQRAVGRSVGVSWDVERVAVSTPVVSLALVDSSSGATTTYQIGNSGADFTPAAGSGYLLFLLSGANVATTALASSVSGSSVGLLFELESYTMFASGPVRCLAVYAAQPATTPALGKLSATWADAQSSMVAALLRVENPATSGALGFGMIHQIAALDTDPNNAGTLTATLAASAVAGSVVVAGFAANLNGQLTPIDASFTELSDTTLGAGKNVVLETQWRNNYDDVSAGINARTVADAATTGKLAGIILELAGTVAVVVAVGRSVSVAWDVAVLAPVTTTTVVDLTLNGTVTYAELGVDPGAPPASPEFRIKVNGVWTLVAGSRATEGA